MRRDFGVTGIRSSTATKSIQIEFSHEVDPDSAHLGTIYLTKRGSNSAVSLDISVVKKTITLTLKEWPAINEEYSLLVRSEVSSIVGDTPPDSLHRTIIFKSEVLSKASITQPSRHEEIEDVYVKWEELAEDSGIESLVSSYRVQLSTENVFYNVLKESVVQDKKEIKMANIPEGDYFVRVRPESEASGYGDWSEVIPFTVLEKEEVDDWGDIYESDLEIISLPATGQTPESFLIKFNEDIDIDSVRLSYVKKRRI